MALPTSREETATAAANVKSNTINAIQDAIIGGKKAATKKIINPLPLKFYNSGWNVVTGGAHYIEPAAGSSSFLAPDGFEVGDRITGFEVRAYGNGVADITYTLMLVSPSGLYTTLSTITDLNRAAAWGSAVGVVTPAVLAAGESLLIQVDATNGTRIGAFTLTYDRL